MYDPELMRFTCRDPIKGKTNIPLTLHRYLYCVNNVSNCVDPKGEYRVIVEPILAGYSVHAYAITVAAVGVASNNWNIIAYGIALEKAILPTMAISALMFKHKPTDNELKMIQGYNAGANWNLNPGGPWFPKGMKKMLKWTAIATAAALGIDGCRKGIQDFFDFFEEKEEEKNQAIQKLALGLKKI